MEVNVPFSSQVYIAADSNKIPFLEMSICKFRK